MRIYKKESCVFPKAQSDDLLCTDHSVLSGCRIVDISGSLSGIFTNIYPKKQNHIFVPGKFYVTGNLGKSVVNRQAFPYNERRKVQMKLKQKPLKDLNLLDRFLFAQAADDPDTMRDMLEIILGKEVVLKLLPQTEKEQRSHPLNRYVRLDVWAMDEEDTVYNTEVQKENTGNIPKRSRFYQALIDSNLLAPGEVGFQKLNPVYIILICPFDLFGYGLYRYTFRMQCEEVPELSLKDDAVRIFLNTHGPNTGGVSKELIELLKYMEHTTEEMSRICTSERIHNIQKRIQAIKSSEKIGVKYMQAWEEKIMEQNKAREEGHAAGILEGRASGLKEGMVQGGLQKLQEQIEKKVRKGYSAEDIAEMLETDIETVQKFIKK